jgi:hypothetical protein
MYSPPSPLKDSIIYQYLLYSISIFIERQHEFVEILEFVHFGRAFKFTGKSDFGKTI